GGGFYRYELYDRIQVVGFYRDCPLVKFLGKTNLVSDLVGEKLNEAHVREVLNRVFRQHQISPTFALVVPVNDSCPPYYTLYLQDARMTDAADFVAQIGRDVETGLKQNLYYSQAIQLFQLSGLRVVVLKASESSAWEIYERGCNSRGQKVGDIKPTTLDPRPFWGRDFSSINSETH
ncbi:MAG: GH3 auxin-responsive promoter family protein, partial [Planctomycetaceae bacterium]|nr:GH3 auxin-responsive promoter family protein [Planctomycetaceae bacterium]